MKQEDAARGNRGRGFARAAFTLAALAICALAFSPKPPPGRLLGVIAAWLEEHGALAAAIGDSGLALLLGAGAVALLAIALDELIRKIRGGKTGSAGRRLFRPRSFVSSLIAYIFLLLAAMALRRLPQEEPGRAAESPITAAAEATGSGGSGRRGNRKGYDEIVGEGYRAPIVPLMAAGAALAGAGAALVLLRRARSMRDLALSARPILLDEGEEAAEAEAVAAARRALEADPSPRAAIIRCYAAMCDLFSRAARFGAQVAAPSLTARELAAFLRSKGAGETEIAALTEAFEKARYSNEECGEADRAGAARALEAIELAYGGGAA